MATRRLAKPRPVQGEQAPLSGGPPRSRVRCSSHRETGGLDGWSPSTESGLWPAKGKPCNLQGFPILGKRPRASPVHHELRERTLRDCPTRRNAVGQSAWLSQIPAPCLPMSACSERRLLNEQDGPAEPPSNQRDVRVELVARNGLFGRDATRSCNSCRCGCAVDSAQRFRSSSLATASWPMAETLAHALSRSAASHGCRNDPLPFVLRVRRCKPLRSNLPAPSRRRWKG